MNNLGTDDLENAPCGFLTFSDSGTINSINSTLINLLGYQQKKEIAGKSIEALFTIAGRIFYQTHFFPLIKLHGKASEIFFSLITKKNETLPVICNAVRKESNGVFINHCILIPVTERGKYEQELLMARRQAEEALGKNHELIEAKKERENYSIELDRQVSRLIQINDDISQFSKVISHDLQEPIHKIAVLADKTATEARQFFSEQGLQDLEKINYECRKLRHLAADLERFISLNTKTEEFTSLDLNELVKRAYLKSVIPPERNNVIFTAEQLPVIDGYNGQVELLFYNLFENCLKFKDTTRPLHITVESMIIQQNSFRTIKGRYRYIDFVKILVSDNGRGFDNKYREEVFKLQQQPSGKSGGFGLGLAFCKKIADNHYGNINASSTVDKGTTITILLPLKQSS